MNTPENDDIFARKAREVFLASTASLDSETLARLRTARARAVEAVGVPARWQMRGWRLPAGVAALIAVALLGGFLWMGGAGTTAPASAFSKANSDAPLMMANDNLDMYGDMDFYQWMAAQDQPAAQPSEPVDDSEDDDDDSGVGG
ncbi:MAG TPA: hypothetical protein VKT74_01395 [Gammaproteobacteria bacterium]|nr:hypothetical protein [Gammaproteobacteria bacterium]